MNRFNLIKQHVVHILILAFKSIVFVIISERVLMPLAVVVSIIIYFIYAAIIYLDDDTA